MSDFTPSANQADPTTTQRIDRLIATDPQFAAARPTPGLAERLQGLALPQVIDTVLTEYAGRPALGERAVRFTTDDRGRTVSELQPGFDTITYRELARRVRDLGAALVDGSTTAGDRVAILGFAGVDYTTIDIALNRIGAVSVPLQPGASPAVVRAVLAETEPTALAVSIDNLDFAVTALGEGYRPGRVIVFDYRRRDDRQSALLCRAAGNLAGLGVTVETLTVAMERGRALAAPVPQRDSATDDLALLVYTSGSTGAPKGAVYTRRMVAGMWVRSEKNWAGPAPTTGASITLNFMPMSHVMGRSILYGTLGNGGTAYFTARSDLSTLLEDLSLVRPTELNLVPRVWELLAEHFQRETAQAESRGAGSEAAADVSERVRRHLRDDVLGGRYITAMSGSAPISAELRSWVESVLEMPLQNGYGSTEAGMVTFDGRVQRPPVVDYKLIDVPELGYYSTDRPHPRGELLVKTERLFPGYYRRPETTAAVFDADGYYRTGDIMAEVEPDRLVYVDRRNNVVKLAQGEFVTLAKLEAAYGTSPLVHQIYLYGNSARAYLLAVVVPTAEALAEAAARAGGEGLRAVKSRIAESLQQVAHTAGLQSYEVPRDFLIEAEPFTQANGLLTGIGKLAWPQLKERYGRRLEDLYAARADDEAGQLDELRRSGAGLPAREAVRRAAAALLGAPAADLSDEAHFTDLGGDSLSALSFGNLLSEIFGVDVPVGVIVSPASDLAAIAAHIDAERSGARRPTAGSVHGGEANALGQIAAADLTLDKFLDAATLRAVGAAEAPRSDVRTVLLTGATGFLGRHLALEWLQRMERVDGTVVCLVRAKSDLDARRRLDAVFDSGDPGLLDRYRGLADKHLRVIAGDKGEPGLGLPSDTWQRLARDVDVIVDPAALVNHVLPYSELFGPNVTGTAELIRLAVTERIKPYTYLSTIGVGDQIPAGQFREDADVRAMSPMRAVNDDYANGYGNSKWAGEVLLREAYDRCGLPVTVLRCDMILADTEFGGQLNLPDMFTRMMLSLAATGIAPASFYELDANGRRPRAHYDGLPVGFVTESVAALGATAVDGFTTYHVMNPHDDGISMDSFVDWLIDARDDLGIDIERVGEYDEWLQRFETALRALPEKQRQASLLPLLHNYQKPQPPMNGSVAATDVFTEAVRANGIGTGPGGSDGVEIPHITPEVIVKYVTDLRLLELL